MSFSGELLALPTHLYPYGSKNQVKIQFILRNTYIKTYK